MSSRIAPCREDFSCGDDFDVVLAIFWSHDFGANAPKTIEKIGRDEKHNQKCSLCVLVRIATT